jgi:hypothetical protein
VILDLLLTSFEYPIASWEYDEGQSVTMEYINQRNKEFREDDRIISLTFPKLQLTVAGILEAG